MLFNSEEKNMMMGAFTTGGLYALLDGYYGYSLGAGRRIDNIPTDGAYWLYKEWAGPWLPSLAQALPWFGVPALIWWLGKRKRSSKLRYMGIGGLVFGVAEFIAVTTNKITAMAVGNPYWTAQPYTQ